MKYEDGVKKRLEEGADEAKQIKDEAALGKSDLEVQISLLDAEVIKAKQKEKKKEKAFSESKYAMPFSLKAVDNAEEAYNNAVAERKSLEKTRESRKALKKELFG